MLIIELMPLIFMAIFYLFLLYFFDTTKGKKGLPGYKNPPPAPSKLVKATSKFSKLTLTYQDGSEKAYLTYNGKWYNEYPFKGDGVIGPMKDNLDQLYSCTEKMANPFYPEDYSFSPSIKKIIDV